MTRAPNSPNMPGLERCKGLLIVDDDQGATPDRDDG